MSLGPLFFSVALLLTRTSSVQNLSVDGLSDISASSRGGQSSSTQHGQCTYTFILPENMEERGKCWPPENGDEYEGNSVQRDAPLVKQSLYYQRILHLEVAIDNYTKWLQQVGNDDSVCAVVRVDWMENGRTLSRQGYCRY